MPLAMIGLWLTQSAVRSGRALLEDQLRESVTNIQQSVDTKWDLRRGDLLFLAGNEVVDAVLFHGEVSAADSAFLTEVASAMSRHIAGFTYSDRAGAVVYSSTPAISRGARQGAPTVQASAPPRPTMSVDYPVHRADKVLGSVTAQVFLDAILPSDSARLLLPGSALALRDYQSGDVLVRLRGAVDFPTTGVVAIAGDEWMLESTRLSDPPLELVVAGPLGPYVKPFQRDGRTGLVALAILALTTVMLTTLLTTRLAGTVGGLVETAGAVADGDLGRQARVVGPLEFQRLAASFNTMTESLRRLVTELSERRALAAVGEFAAALSHEVRNALTSVQIDLERVEERSEDAKNRRLIGRTLSHVRRLDAAVTGSLRIARTGRVESTDIDLSQVLRDTVKVAKPSFAASGTRLVLGDIPASVVRGDAEAFHQLFLNLLLNAQQAMAPNDEASVSGTIADGHLIIAIDDRGSGMTVEQIQHAFDPYFTTRTKGTGLGLPIARNIAIAYGGDLAIQSTLGVGTVVEVRFPLGRTG